MCLSKTTRHYFRSKDLQNDSHPQPPGPQQQSNSMADRRKYPVCGPAQIQRHLNLDRLCKNELKQWILALSKAELTGILAEVPLSSRGTGAEWLQGLCLLCNLDWTLGCICSLGTYSSLFLPSPVVLGLCAGVPRAMPFTLHIRETGMLLNVLSMLAFTPGGGSNTKMRPARSRFTGT